MTPLPDCRWNSPRLPRLKIETRDHIQIKLGSGESYELAGLDGQVRLHLPRHEVAMTDLNTGTAQRSIIVIKIVAVMKSSPTTY